MPNGVSTVQQRTVRITYQGTPDSSSCIQNEILFLFRSIFATGGIVQYSMCVDGVSVAEARSDPKGKALMVFDHRVRPVSPVSTFLGS